MVVYHEISASSLSSVLKHGLKTTIRGNYGRDEAIIKTDHILDKHIPPQLVHSSISRSDSIYGYIGSDTFIISIDDGRHIALEDFAKQHPGPHIASCAG